MFIFLDYRITKANFQGLKKGNLFHKILSTSYLIKPHILSLF